MKKFLYIIALFISFSLSARRLEENIKPAETSEISRISNEDLTFQLPRYIFTYTNTRIIVKFNNPNSLKLINNNYQLDLIINGTNQKVIFDKNGMANFYYTFKNNSVLQVLIEDVNYTVQPATISIWFILTPLFTILLFFIYKIASMVKKNKTPKLVFKHNSEITETEIKSYPSILKVVKIKEFEEEY